MTVLTTPALEYPELFQEYLERALQEIHESIENCGSHLPDMLRDDALHLLKFGLQIRNAWITARKLLLILSPKMEIAGFRDEWISYLQQGVKIGESCQDFATTAELRFQIGYLLRLCSNFTESTRWLVESLNQAKGCQQWVIEAKALNQLAYVAWQKHEYDQANEFAQQALNLLDATHIERAMSLSALGLVAFHQRRLVESEQYHRSALEIRTQQQDKRATAWSLQNLGLALREQNRFPEAFESYQKAISLLAEMNDDVNGAIAQMNLGILYRRMEQHQHSLEAHLGAERVFRIVGDKLNLANNYTNIGLEHLSLGNFELSAEAFLASSKLFAEIGNYSWQLNALDGLGIVYLKQERYFDAIAVFEQILREISTINDRPMEEYLKRVVPQQLLEAQQKFHNLPV